jgi:Sap, sulfolipid-1-addressing protein
MARGPSSRWSGGEPGLRSTFVAAKSRVIIELLILGLATAVRPGSLAAVYALLASSSPRRLLLAYVIAGGAFTIGFGVLVIWVFHGIDIKAGTNHTKAVAEISGGFLAIAFGVLLLTGRIGTRPAREAPEVPNRWIALLNKKTTVRKAALAGPATHIPGIFYLIALNLIVTHQLRLQRGVFSLLFYNGVWFSLPIMALAVCVIDPGAASKAVSTGEHWARQHARVILIIVSFGLGTVFLINGLRTG